MMQAKQDVSSPKAVDARKLRSRDALFAAFLTLLEQKNLDQISIREIAAAANIGHATFYRHYATKEELLNDLAAGEIRRLVNLTLPVMNAKSTQAACEALCRHVFSHKKLWTTLLTGGASSVVKEELLTISRRVAAELDNNVQSPELAELKTVLSVNSILETLVWWLRQRKPLAGERVARTLTQIIALHDKLKVG
jgi:AcrR family transcriptional regulator